MKLLVIVIIILVLGIVVLGIIVLGVVAVQGVAMHQHHVQNIQYFLILRTGGFRAP